VSLPITRTVRPLASRDTTAGSLTIALVLLLLTSLAVEAVDGATTTSWAVIFLPALFTVACMWAGIRIVTRRAADAWTPLPWWLFTSAAYFGIGTLASSLGSDDSLSYMAAFFEVDDVLILRTLSLNIAGLVAVLVGFRFAGNLQGLSEMVSRLRPRHRSELFWIRLFAWIGMPVFFLLKVPAAFGLFETLVVAESVMILVTFYVAALALLAGMVARGKATALPWLLLLGGAHAVGSLLMFSKLEYILLGLGVLLGIYRVRRRVIELGVGCALLLIIYLVSLPLVNFGRETTRSDGSTASRAAATSEFLSGGRLQDSDSGVQSWWTRLCYVPIQAFVMLEYENGRTGGTFDTLTYALIPRVLWPGKPLVTQGDRLTFLVNGSTTSMSAPTVVGECYWAGGWWLVAVGGFFIGVLQRLARELIAGSIEAGNVGIVPFALVLVRMGLRPDDYFVSTWIASLPVVILFLVFVGILSSFRWSQPRAVRRDPALALLTGSRITRLR
jgi:hypothetical protein